MAKKRPTISTIKSNLPTSTEEAFQNETLRPIIKMQHDLLIAFFRHYLTTRKLAFQDLPDQQKIDFIERTLKNDMPFRNQLKGLFIGHFTVEEYELYLTAQRGLNKRLLTIVRQRLGDSLDQLV